MTWPSNRSSRGLRIAIPAVLVVMGVAVSHGAMADDVYEIDPSQTTMTLLMDPVAVKRPTSRDTTFGSGTVAIDGNSVREISILLRFQWDRAYLHFTENMRRAEEERCPKGQGMFDLAFESKRFETIGPTTGKLTGDLTLYCTTRPTTFDVEFHFVDATQDGRSDASAKLVALTKFKSSDVNPETDSDFDISVMIEAEATKKK